DQLDDRRALNRLKLVDLCFEGQVARVCHGYAFHGCQNPDSDKNVPSAWAGCPAGRELLWLLLRPSHAWTFPVHPWRILRNSRIGGVRLQGRRHEMVASG